MINKPGLYPDVSEQDYHADPVHVPSLSSSIAKVILSETPLHAKMQHPKLKPDDAEGDTAARKMDIGSGAHKLLLGKGAEIVVIDADSYRGKEAKEARDAATAAGKIPLLKADMDAATDIVSSVKTATRQIPGCEDLFRSGHGRPEVVMVWQDQGGPWCRAMMDWYVSEQPLIVDVKTTAAGLSDRALSSRISEGYDLSAGFYIRGLAHIYPELAGRIRFMWVFIEQSPPYEVRVIEADRTTLDIGDRKAAHAIEIWRRCIESSTWPGYPRRIERLDYPTWAETRWMERELIEDHISSAAHRMNSALVERQHKPIVYGA